MLCGSRFFHQLFGMLDKIHMTAQTHSLVIDGEVRERNTPQFQPLLDPKDFDKVLHEVQQDLRELCPNNDLSDVELDKVVVSEALKQMMPVSIPVISNLNAISDNLSARPSSGQTFLMSII
jgi:hypothetical protein